MLKNIYIHNVFIYITEKCNLSCDYCFFKDKKDRTLDYSTIENFVNFLYRNLRKTPKNFIISGGEPLLFASLVNKTVKYIRQRFKNVNIVVQTNGIKLYKQEIKFIRDNKLNLEIGMDGDFITTKRHRRGIDKRNFNLLIENIRKCIESNINTSCTMTVHPEEVVKLYENFLFLSNLGIRNIDITPAALVKWHFNQTSLFKKKYLRLIKERNNFERLYIEEDIAAYKNFFLDLSLHPQGYVFCGDVYLCLPENIRKKYNLFDFSKNNFNKIILKYFLKHYLLYFRRFKKSKISYRDYICFSFKIINKISNNYYRNLGTTIRLLNFINKANLKSLKNIIVNKNSLVFDKKQSSSSSFYRKLNLKFYKPYH